VDRKRCCILCPAMLTAIKEIRSIRLGGTVAFLTVLLLGVVFTAGSPAILQGQSTLAFQLHELQALRQVEAAPTMIYGPIWPKNRAQTSCGESLREKPHGLVR